MSDRFYDNKGIEHYGGYAKEDAERANRRYLQEEEEARQNGLDLQRQQLEAAERATREADLHRQEQAKAERERLSELARQGAAAQRDRDYQNQVLFLKESDETTRLDRFIEMLVNTLDWKCCPKDAKGYNDRTWVAERERIFSLFYQLPELPNECKAGGTLTRQILTLVNSNPKPPEIILPDEAMPLKNESDKLDNKLQQLEKDINTLKHDSSSFGCLGILGGLMLAFGAFAFVFDKVIATNPSQWEFTISFCILIVGLILIVTNVARRPMRRSRMKANREKLDNLYKTQKSVANKKELIQRELLPFWDKARKQIIPTITPKEVTEQWFSTYRNSLLKSFFDQGLWIADRFQTRLQDVLTEIQKPFPTSCRADVSKLSRSQIETAYKAVVDAVVDLFRFKLSRASHAPGYNDKWPLSYALFPDKHIDNDEYKKQEAVFLEKGVLLEGNRNKVESDQQSKIITDLLMAGPTALWPS